MKALKVIGVIILILVLLFLLIAALLPRQIHVEHSVVVNTHIMCPFNQVNNLHHWENWSPFDDDVTDMEHVYEGPVSGVGAVYKWSSEKGGTGSMVIMESNPFEKIMMELDFEGKGKSVTYFAFEEMEENKTKVTWGYDDEASYPLERVIYALMKGHLNELYAKGLDSIKGHCEAMKMSPKNLPLVCNMKHPDKSENVKMSKKDKATPHLYVLELNNRIVAYIEDSGSFASIKDKMEKNFTALEKFILENEIEDYGNPFTVWNSWDEENMTASFDCGISVRQMIEGTDDIKLKETPEMKVVGGIHYGPYDQSEYMYLAIEEYVKKNNLEVAGGPIELYVTDPSQEPDPAKWETAILWPVK